jgi:hypothetical protein
MNGPWHSNGGSRARAEYLAKQGLAVGSIRRMVTYQFRTCPSDKVIQDMVDAEAAKRARDRARHSR